MNWTALDTIWIGLHWRKSTEWQLSRMCPFDQLHSILKDYIMLLHNKQRKWEDSERSGGDDQKGENGHNKWGRKENSTSPIEGPSIEHRKLSEPCWECRACVECGNYTEAETSVKFSHTQLWLLHRSLTWTERPCHFPPAKTPPIVNITRIKPSFLS